jgi:hypothetical protein
MLQTAKISQSMANIILTSTIPGLETTQFLPQFESSLLNHNSYYNQSKFELTYFIINIIVHHQNTLST